MQSGIRAVLSGGACASIYTDGAYQSLDLDFILQTAVSPAVLDAAMGAVGFTRQTNQYFHPTARFYVEFPPGPLSIGRDYHVQPVETKVGRSTLVTLTPTDSCRDRLAAFFHWNDRQSLTTALAIARRHEIDLAAIRRWSQSEGAVARFDEFVRELQRSPRNRRSAARRKRSG